MSASNTRIKECDTVHHLVSRIAHKVFFLGDDERNDMIAMVRRAAEFGGLRLLGWCIMTNHFHLLVHLPVRGEVSDEEVLRRVGILKGQAGLAAINSLLASWRVSGDEERVKAWFDRQRARMYDIGEFMKIVKQWFTEEYNRRQSHVGTLWESVYHDHLVPMKVKDMAHVLGYIHLNPVRAAACAKAPDYTWSSFAALAKGDGLALDGMRFVYDEPEATAEELIERHSALLDALLEGIKRRRAEEIARKRAAGFEMKLDPLTNEAMVAQAAAHLNEVQNALTELRAERETQHDRMIQRRRDVSDDVLLAALLTNPTATAAELSQRLSLSTSCVYERLKRLQKHGVITRVNRTAPWQIVENRSDLVSTNSGI